jgi:PPOX class probable F420-dependent enzyme
VLDLDSPAGVRADRRLRAEQVVWLTTVRADGQPQASPVWFLWDGETFLLYSQADAQKLRNLAGNPRVALHLDSDGVGGDVVSIEGTATVDPQAPPADQVEAYRAKYQERLDALGSDPAALARDYPVAVRVRPDRARAW